MKNPFNFKLSSVVENNSKTREAITVEQEEQFLNFIKESSDYSKYYEGIYILFNTGLRISELCGLTIADIDFNEMTLNVNKQLAKINGKYSVEEVKTAAGKRVLPLSNNVLEMFKSIIEKRRKVKKEPMFNGYSGFIFLNKSNNPMVSIDWQLAFRKISYAYIEEYPNSKLNITPHTCRHTYCSNMAKSGINPKALQYLMGHSNIGVTLNVYTHLGLEDARAEICKILDAKKVR
ncbi:hypothetical protein P261_00429 [Lachnospiraceae bacterium TWA4]|nr:hypothetical protein P261_00429 [Lachnospiraceae bacterium TWA4]